MERNWNLLGKSYIEALRRIRAAKALDAVALRLAAAEEMEKAKRRVQNGGYLYPPRGQS